MGQSSAVDDFDLEGGAILSNGREVLLTPRLAQLFGLLHKRLGRWVNYESLHAAGFDGPRSENGSLASNLLGVHCTRLRKLVAAAGYRIETHRGFGYRLVRDGQASHDA